MKRIAVRALCVAPEAWRDDGFGGRELRPLLKGHVRGHMARNPGGHGMHRVSDYERHLASLPKIADSAEPYGSHANWLAAHDKLLEAATARLMAGKYAQARGLYDLASNVRWSHDTTFGINDRIARHGDTGPISNEAHRAHYAMWYPKEQHPVQAVNAIMKDRLNKQGRADKVNAIFRHDRAYQIASDSGDRKQVEAWWKQKIAEFESNPELVEYTQRAIEKWKGGLKVAPTDPNKCDRCGGKGHLDAFKHVEGGTCFECGGTGVKDVGEVMQKAVTLRATPLASLRKAEAVSVDLATVQRDDLGRPTAAQFHVGAYLFRFRKAGKGLPILTVTGPKCPLPYHMVVRGHADAMRRAPDIAKVFQAGGCPDEGVFRMEDDASVTVRYPGRTQAQA